MRMTLRTSFLPVSTTGLRNAPRSTSLIVSNLQSPLDTFILSFVQRPFLLMVPERAKKAPIVGWMLRLAGMIFVSSDRRGQLAALKACTDALKTGKSVAVFPEGMPRMDGVIASFPSAIFSAARKSGVPIVPVTINGSFKMFGSGFAPVRRPSTSISLTVHETVSYDSDDKETARNVREVIRNGLPASLRGESDS
ncbi:1-acyl-sn-glycerol-3-phosphate acyltransferase [Gracilaria domingensis]|nr:1-acyl-sn-glycerol-3-phosphate acyltransferase [Gracilaria domingensis]